jgi:glutathione S-transferase
VKPLRWSAFELQKSFRPLLGERMEVIVPPTHYDKVDF